MSRYAGRRVAARRRSSLPLVAAAIALVLVAAASAWFVLRDGGASRAGGGRDDVRGEDQTEQVDPATPLGWGPTAGDLQRARDIVADWNAEKLAGQVLVGRFHGTDPEIPAQMVRDLHLAGVSVQGENVEDTAQVRDTTAAVSEAVAADGRDWPAVIGVDQEGGVVAHLDGVATEFPSFAHAGRALAASPEEAPAVIREAAMAMGLELRDLGFTWVWAPVADVSDGTDPTIGSRSPSEDPALAATAIREAVGGFNDAAIISTTKHFPGHGAVDGDSHKELPQLEAALEELKAKELVPFEAAVGAQAPSMMMSHLDVTAIQPGVPATHADKVYDYLAEEIGFEGVVITDSLGMGAVMGRPKPVVSALVAGADLLLMPADTARAHADLVAAIESGEVPRERVEEAAAKVIALQLWLGRSIAETPVPDDVSENAEAASSALDELGS